MKTRTMKKGLAFLLSLTMLLGLLPMSVFAAGETETATIYQATGDEYTYTPAPGSEEEKNSEAGDLVEVLVVGNDTTYAKIEGTTTDSKAYYYSGEGNNRSITVDASVTKELVLGGTIVELTVSNSTAVILQNETIVGSLTGTVSIPANATVTVGGVEYTNDSNTALDLTNGAVAGLTITGGEDVEVTVNSDSTLSVSCSGTPNVSYTGTSTVTVYGDVGTLNATNGDVTVNGDVTAISGGATSGSVSPEIKITGDLGSASVWNNGATTFEYEVEVAGTAGKIELDGASAATFELKNGRADLLLVSGSGDNAEMTFDKTNNVLYAKPGYDNDKGDTANHYIQNKAEGAIAYNIVIEKGTFDANGQNVSGNVTFSGNGKITGTGKIAKPADEQNTITVADGVTANIDMQVGEKVNGASSSNPTISIGAGATANFSYARLTDSQVSGRTGCAVTEIGNGATISVDTPTDKASGDNKEKSGVDTVLFPAIGTTGYGPKVTFMLDKDSVIYGNGTIVTAANTQADVTVKWTEAGSTFNKTITVGRGTTLSLEGSKAGNLTIGGAKPTTVEEDATLNLTRVNHTRDDTPVDYTNIVTAAGATVKMDASTNYTGKTDGGLGKFETSNTPAAVAGVPKTVTLTIGGTTLTSSTQALKAAVSNYDQGRYTKVEDNGDLYTLKLSDSTSVLPEAEIAMAVFTNNGALTVTTLKGFSADVTVNGVGADPTDGQSLMAIDDVGASAIYTGLTTGDSVSIDVYPTEAGSKDEVSLPAEQATAAEDTTLDVVLKDGTYKNNFIVHEGATMNITLEKDAQIGSTSKFTLDEGATLNIVDKTPGINLISILACMEIDANDVTVTLDGVTWEQSTGANDEPAILVDAGVTGAKLIVKSNSSITGEDNADFNDTTVSHNHSTAANPNHSQSAGILNQGALEVQVDEGATLSVNGGAADDSSTANPTYYGGAAVYNDGNSANLTFTGAGVIALTGGQGSKGYTGINQDGNVAGTGGTGGAGLYNNGGSVTVKMDSETWNEGQLAITGGKGGQGGTAGSPSHANTKGGTGGQGGTAAVTGNDFTVESGVFLAYAGYRGAAGAGSGSCGEEHTDTTNNVKYSHYGYAGSAGSSGSYAITGTTLTVNGGTTYAFGGVNGGQLTNMVVTGGTIFGGKLDTGATDATMYDGFNGNTVSALATTIDMVPALGSTGTGFTVTKGVTNRTDTNVYFTRIKTGTEGYKYLVKDIKVTLANETNATSYDIADTGMYANEQGFLYVYLPDKGTPSSSYDKAVVTLKQDGAEVYYQMTCGGASGYDSAEDKKESSMQAYGYGDVWTNTTVATDINNSRLNYDGNAAWGAEFQLADGTTVANGVDMDAVDDISELTADPNPYNLDTPEKLAALAYMVNTTDKDFTNIDFRIGVDAAGKGITLDMSALTWTPIGKNEAHAFAGILKGDNAKGDSSYGTLTQRTIRGLRLSAEYNDGDAFGLFGYTKGASISHITVDNDPGQLGGKAYVKTLTTNGMNATNGYSTTNYGVLTGNSGGKYGWTADQLAWNAETITTASGTEKPPCATWAPSWPTARIPRCMTAPR